MNNMRQLMEAMDGFDTQDEFGGSDEEEVFFVIVDGDQEHASLVSFALEDGRWREHLHKGPRPYGFGSKTYMSYLTPGDLHSWLARDYDSVRGPFDYGDGMDEWLDVATPGQDGFGMNEAPQSSQPEPDLDLPEPEIMDLDQDIPDDNEPKQQLDTPSRARSNVVRVYRDLGVDNPNPEVILVGLRRLSEGKVPMGIQAQSLSVLSTALLNMLGDPTAVTIFLRSLNR